MTPAQQTRWIVERARALGFDLCGVAPVTPEHLAELARLPEWLDRGYAGEMKYLHDARRADPRQALDGAKAMIVVALNYNTPYEPDAHSPGDAPRGWISRYAWGDDYHDVLREKLNALLVEMRARTSEPFEARAYVDTGPIIERVAAKYAGLGWLGKNTCLIHPKLGSWLFLGVILTTLALDATVAPGSPAVPDYCGACTRCLDACPTQAFPQPYVLDARRCISYLTIELRGEIPEELRPQLGSAAIGCDICQDVCPWNRKAPVAALAAFEPRERLLAPELEWLASLTQEEFSAVFRKSAVKRAKWRGIVRNACIALGNSAPSLDPATRERVGTLLDRLASCDDGIIASHARWALAQFAAPDSGSPSGRSAATL
ncbi:MAG TPA: tRNA epoxyqueuosine(34) reductase QueG [Candidatus Acidoferrales bacterium]|nr:tRNA epoxyqueuosine(34) reductase QueG [Candidatus Acidoferrales bacterium]